ncbi:roundabout homolog 2-like [Amphiura filiformis]|uniref:roundabout homolog 2-like n=1 Tax=Amphiura filiformis TaxID=82378 RepID=UPI003B21EE64
MDAMMLQLRKSWNLIAVTRTLIFMILVVSCVAGNTRRRDDFPPRIVEHPESEIVKKNLPATLNCRAEGRPQPTITWLKDGEPIGDDQHRTIAITGVLYFLRVVAGNKRDDTGTYQCVATNDMGVAYSNNVTLEIAYLKSEFRDEPSDTVAVVGEPIILECTPPRGNPPPVVSWQKDGEIVQADGNRVRIMDDGNLMISEARQTDTGNYICVVENGYFDVKKSSPAIVNIHARPTFLHAPEDIVSAPGDTINIQCEVEGDPRPVVTWSKQGGDLPQGRFTVMSDNSLRLFHIATQDEGIYICSAENIWGTNDIEAQLTVTTEPTFTKEPVDRTIKLGETAVLNCRATGNPQPVIFWQKENLELIFSSQNGRFSVTEDGSLEIASVTVEDQGYYVCTAYSNVGSVKARAFLRVILPPDHQRPAPTGQPPPIIQYGPSNQTLVIGTEAIFLCQASGTPEPTIEWTNDGEPVEFSTQRYVSRFSILESGALQVASLRQRDSGVYKCTARNENGETHWSATLDIIDNEDDGRIKETPSLGEYPNPPGQPIASNITLHTVRLQWDEPERPRESHTTRWNIITWIQICWHVISRNVQGTNYLVQNLQSEQTYLFLVRAVSNKAVGLPSRLSDPVLTIEVTEVAPTIEQILAETRPRITSAIPLSQAAIKIVWEVEENRDAVEGYFVKYKPRYSDHSFSSMEVVTGSTSNRILTGLEPAKEYLVIVQPFHGKIEGPDSEPVSVRTLSDGSELEESSGPINGVLKEKLDTCGIAIVKFQAMGPYTLKVSWEVERYSAYIDGYHVRFWPGRNNEEFSVESVSTDGRTDAVLHSLAPWTEYTVAVQPFKDRFTGKFSEEVHVRTLEDVPKAAPIKVEAKSHNSTSIHISWLPAPPGTIPGILLGYHVYCLGNTSSQHQNRSTDNTSLDLTVDGLQPGRMYRVQVAAYTQVGTGPPNKVLYVVLPEADEVGMISSPYSAFLLNKKYIIIMSIGIIMLVIFITCIVFVYKRYNKPKQASPTNKATISRDNAAVQNMPCLGGQLNTNQSSNHQVWTDQTWPPPHNCQDNKCTHYGNNRGCMTTASCCNGKGSLTDTLDKNQFLYPSWAATGAPHMWQQYSTYADPEATKHPYPPNLQSQESKETQDTQSSRFCGSNPTLSTFHGSISRQGKVILTKPSPCSTPEYAIVENDEYMSQHTNSLPHNKCPNHPEGAVITVMPQDPVPYASATLFLAPNMREYMAHRNKCQENSADSRCSSRLNSSRVDSGMYGDIENMAYSGSGGSLPGHKPPGMMDPPLSCLSEYATVGHSDSGNSTGTDERGSRRRFKIHGGLSNNHPVRNWKELLPPPPEQPPTDIDSPPSSPDYPCPAITYSAHGTPNCCQSSNTCPSGSCHDMHCQDVVALSMPRDKAPLPPLRQHHSMSPEFTGETAGLLPANGQHPNSNSIHGSKGAIQEHVMPNNLSSHQKELHMEQTVPLLSNLPDRTGGDTLATRQVFEDPRHEQLGKELLEFNDEMSQSEMCTDNEEEGGEDRTDACTHLSNGHDTQNGIANGHRPPPYLPDVNTNKGEVDTDNETASICTDSMLATWDSVNGSTNSSARNSCASLSSEGSFFTNADFASAVAAAAEHAGMQVTAGSQAANQRPGCQASQANNRITAGQRSFHSNSDPTAPLSTNKQPPPPVAKKPSEKGGDTTVNGSNSPVLQRVKAFAHNGYHSNGNDHHSNGSSRHSSPSNTASRRGSLKHHHGKENGGVNPSDKLLLRETNDLGLTVTANPMAFAVEKNEALHV